VRVNFDAQPRLVAITNNGNLNDTDETVFITDFFAEPVPRGPGGRRRTHRIEAPNGSEIVTTVYLSSVASREEGRALATRVTAAALDRVGFWHGVAIENAQRTSEQLAPLNPPPGVLEAAPGELMIAGSEVRLVVGISPVQVKTELEQMSPPGERAYGLLRSARLSMSPVEEFMHLYNILLMMFNDRQSDADTFILSEDPTVPRTQHPHKSAGVMETAYTRLRNEFAHKRGGVNLDNTKAEMANRVGGLGALTKRAIELRM
jgi:hypothetical protein